MADFFGFGGGIVLILFTSYRSVFINHVYIGMGLGYIYTSLGFGLLYLYYRARFVFLFLSLLLHPYTGLIIFILSLNLRHLFAVLLSGFFYFIWYLFSDNSLSYIYKVTDLNRSNLLFVVAPLLISYLSLKLLQYEGKLFFSWREAFLLLLFFVGSFWHSMVGTKIHCLVSPLILMIANFEYVVCYSFKSFWKMMLLFVSLCTLFYNLFQIALMGT